MKKLFVIIFVGIALISCHAQKNTSKTDKKNTQELELNTFKDTVSYVIGGDIANSFKNNKIEVDIDKLILGLRAASNGVDTIFTTEEIQGIMTRFQQEMQMKQQLENMKTYATNKELGRRYMESNLKKEGVKQTESGLQYKVLREGSGEKPVATSTVKVHYEGKLIDGKIFDSSYERGEPIEFGLNQVIKGWTEGLQLMNVGSMYEFVIPCDLGYGERAMQTIPAGSTLIFKVELLDFK
ncbi:MAG: FKBP-type peptidyl-prolyl cis-trans isomerase [Bacteroidales bacterium]|jgi:FKBP-type peptidyl-prolyl cis-trans isomerase FklB|nr:FKBP-type peptidyl-prolyl cis-trans isomerase [Bacteroidales bacterium]